MAIRVDVAVIGAGAFGLSVALHCALRGRSVVVVERKTAGSQASRRAAGLFKSVQPDALRTALARQSVTKVLRFEDWTGVPLAVQRSGSVLVARTDQHKAVLREEAERSRSWGVKVTDADPATLAEFASYYQPSGKETAIWCPEDAYIEEPSSLIDAYLAAARRHGVELLENEPAVTVLAPSGRVIGLETTARQIDADVVVDAAGAWARQVAELARGPFPRRKVPVAPYRHQLLITEPTDEVQPNDAIVRVLDAATYLRPARGGLMVGVFEADPLPLDPRMQPESFGTEDVPLDPAVLRQAAGQLTAEVPVASQQAVAEHRGGLITMTPDGRFVAGPVLGLPGLWVASGCNCSGFSLSPAIGETLADWIVEDHPAAAVRMEPFAPSRFGPVTDEDLITRGAWEYAHFYHPVDA
jgi:glycine/D-amino acid oxidase-like deaminating enzyme